MVSVVTTFSGRGGSSLGYNLAKCKILLSIDFEPNAVKTYKLNFPKTPIWKKDIREITGKQILDEIKLKKGELDIFDGSPPCTPFSLAGIKDKGWGKKYQHSSETKIQRTDDLFYEYIRLIREIKPRAFLAENVRGLIMGNAKGYFNNILKAMKSAGYKVIVFDLNAKNFEVPQSRPRVVFIGIRKDIKIKFPSLMTFPEITFEQVTKNLTIPKDDLDAAIKATQRGSIKPYLKYVQPGENFQRHHPKDNQFTYVRVRNDRPCSTITAAGYGKMFHPTEHRALTIAEAKRCSTFPDDFKFLSLSDAWIGIGNSVPPNLIMHLANYIKNLLL